MNEESDDEKQEEDPEKNDDEIRLNEITKDIGSKPEKMESE